ncbi:MAG: hypothetical protein ACXVB1_15750 [Pseudobdellovibrionaceae bacterium]
MSNNHNQTIVIDAFPDDDVERVVWWYGAAFINISHASTIPLIEVALRPIISNDGLGAAIVVKVGLPQLNNVRIGSIWKGQSCTRINRHGYEKECFEFKLETSTIESINFKTKKPDSLPDKPHYFIPPYKYDLHSIPKEKGYPYHFENSKITKLISTNNVTVLILALELFTSTYTPRNQEIRSDLFLLPVPDVLPRHINLEKSHVDADGKYTIFLKKGLHKSNSVFLAYLQCNPISQERVRKLWTSLSVEKRVSIGENHKDRYPIVHPYHPNSFKFNADGIWLNKDTFLVFRINKSSLPAEYEINLVSEGNGDHTKNNENQDEIYVSPQHTVAANLPITHEIDPETNAGIAYIKSEVEFFDDGPLINTTTITSDSENNAIRNFLTPNAATHLSSGQESNSLDSKNVAKLKQSEIEKEHSDREHIDQSQVINLVHDALAELIEIENSSIQSIKYLDENAEQYDDFKLASFPRSLFRKNATWPASNYELFVNKEGEKQYKFTPRKFLLAKITLKNATSVYLLEIDRNSSKTGFSGLIFNVPLSTLSSRQLYDLLKTISENKGTFRKRESGKLIDIKLPVSSYHIYDHSLIENSMTKKMAKVVKIAEEKGVF